MVDDLKSVLEKMVRTQEVTNRLLEDILTELKSQKTTRNFDSTIGDEIAGPSLYDPEFLIKFNKRTQDVIKFIARHFSKNNDTLIVEQVQESMSISYPQAASYLNDLEQKGILKSRRGNKTLGEEPLKKYYYIKK